MVVEYKKDLHHNYMVIAESDEQKIEPYCIKMLEHQSIDGILPMEQRRMDNLILFYYDITAKQSLINLPDKTVFSFDRVKLLFENIIQTLERAYEYLLPEDDFILSPEYIYLDITSNHTYLCFYCGQHKSCKEQMNGLIEYLMNKVDYNDKDAVLLIYQLYAASKEEGFTFKHLVEVLEKQTGQELEKANIRREVVKDESLIKDDYRGIQEDILLKDVIAKNFSLKNIIAKDSGRKDIKTNDIKSKDIKSKDIKFQDRKPRDDRSRNDKPGDNKYGENKYGENKSKDIRAKQIKNIKSRNRNLIDTTLPDKMPMKQEQKDFGMSVMMEKVEGEEETLCYSFKTYLYTGACIIGSLIFILLVFTSKILYNTFGNRIDYSKLFALFLIVFCIVGYLLKRIWNKENMITKIVATKEYIDPRQNQDCMEINYSKNLTELSDSEENPIYRKNIGLSNQTKAEKSEQEKKNVEEKKSKKYSKEELLEEEDHNPTCLLNESQGRTSLVLKALEDVKYKNIPIKDFPFFIGKLKKNVDYCLEEDVVSRFHAKITKEQEQYYITDLNSKNGTFVNQEAVQTYQKMEIKIGDEIAFANIKYQFSLLNW